MMERFKNLLEVRKSSGFTGCSLQLIGRDLRGTAEDSRPK